MPDEINAKSYNTYIVIPVFNEEKVIFGVVSEIKKSGYRNIIIVDDGSTDNTYDKIRDIDGVIALKHFLNRGKGAAIKTGIEAAKILSADAVITIDGDGQHDPCDIGKMEELIYGKYDVVLGVRFKNGNSIPFLRVIYNKIGNFFTWLVYGLWVSDSQSGLRAYSRKTIGLLDTKTDRYEYDSEIIGEIKKNKLSFIEIPVKVRYTQYSKNKKDKQNLKNGVKTLIKMLIYR